MIVLIRFQDDSVAAFDDRGRRIARYQGRYDDVRERILGEDAHGVIFAHGFIGTRGIREVTRDEW